MAQQAFPETTEEHPSTGLGDSYVVGADIGGTNLRLALAASDGTIVARWNASTAGIRSAETVIGLISTGVDDLLQQTSVPRSSLRAIAAGAPGVTDVDAGVVIATSYLMGWRNVPLRDLLESKFGVQAFVDNDVNMAAFGEIAAGAACGVQDFVFLAIGTGIGAGIVLNSDIFRGMEWSAGEIGYMLVPGTSEDPAQSNEPGALESMVGGEGIRAQWQNLWRADATSLPKDVTATQIFDSALAGDSLAQSVLERSARILSYAIYNIALILNCPLFVLGGTIGMHPAFVAAVQKMLKSRAAQVNPSVKTSTLGADAALVGAVHMALQGIALQVAPSV